MSCHDNHNLYTQELASVTRETPSVVFQWITPEDAMREDSDGDRCDECHQATEYQVTVGQDDLIFFLCDAHAQILAKRIGSFEALFLVASQTEIETNG